MKIKNIILTLFITALCSVSFGQQQKFDLEWNSNIPISYKNNQPIMVYGFQKENFIYDNVLQTALFAIQLESNILVDEQSFQVDNVIYENLSSENLRNYDVSRIGNSIDVKVVNTNARDEKGIYLEFSPIIKQNGKYKKVTSLQITFNQVVNTSKISTPPPVVGNSVLSEGQWFKFYINRTGVHKLDRSFFSSLGVDVNSVNPQNIRIFGNGGKAIPLVNSEVNEFDVVENAIKFVGESDASFDAGDYALFYGDSAFGWDSVHETNINPYHDKTYYYVNVSANLGKRISTLVEPSGAVTNSIDKFHEYRFHEVDKVNIVRVGRQWFGESFEVNNNQNFNFSIPKMDLTEPVSVKIVTAAAAANNTSMSMALNGVSVGVVNYPAIDPFTLARGNTLLNSVNVNDSNLTVNLNYNNNGNPGANAYLDYISVEAVSDLKSLGGQFPFHNKDVSTMSGVGEYFISDAGAVLEVWDVTDKFNIASKVNDGNSQLTFKAALGVERKYVAVSSNYYTPLVDDVSVGNVNLKGTVFKDSSGQAQDVDYLIITPTIFKSQAEQLAQINRQYQNLRVKVVTLSDIYKEFSTGNQDIGAIRNFVRYVYENGTTDKLKYVCLFGDASYDMKSRENPNHNFVPSYHSFSSFSLISSYISDDYFGMMDESEGSILSSDRLDVAVGRILASSTLEANQMVNKVRQYYEKESFGKWRNKMVIISDDVDHAWESVLQSELNTLADDIVTNRPFVNMTKIHTDAYAQQSSAGSELYPQANADILNNIELGSLVVSYFGHGGEDGLAHERIFQKNHAESLTNICRYNTFITITCEFTRFDNPYRLTAGEVLFLNPSGGAVSLFTTTREIHTFLGIAMNEELAKNLFDFSNTGYVSNAEALRLAKNSISNGLRRVVFSIGDPALKLAIPDPEIRLTKINDVAISDPNVDVLEALDRVKISGEVVDTAGNVLTNYNGLLSTIVFDKNQNRSTIGNDGTVSGGSLVILDYETLGEKVFTGQATVTNGLFDFEFVVPRDILIPVGDGRISFYAKETDELVDQTGYHNSLKIGGINVDAPADNLPPEINAWMNDESFVSGGTTNESPVLLIKLSDDNGINTASGIGHDITAVLDGDEANPIVLNDYYETEPNDFTKGKVSYQLRDLETGLHTLTLKGWDTYNNSATTEIQFVVVNQNDELILDKVLNYPNPFVNYTEFWFNHNSSSVLDVMVQVYTVSGKLIKTIRGTSATNNKFDKSSLSRSVSWDGKDDFGDKIGKGVYVYKLSVKDPSTNKTAVKFEKLVKL